MNYHVKTINRVWGVMLLLFTLLVPQAAAQNTTGDSETHHIVNGVCSDCGKHEVTYRVPTYNTPGDATSGIAGWQTATAMATPVAADQDRQTWTTGWYCVPAGARITMVSATCQGDVHLILCDGSKLTINCDGSGAPGISAMNGNSVCIYGQTAGTGELRVETEFMSGACIGGCPFIAGSNITINGGNMTLNGYAGAGIGGGYGAEGSNITINGGSVRASSKIASAIGGGYNNSGSNNIKVSTNCIITIDDNIIGNNGGDLASTFINKKNVFIHLHEITKVEAKAATCSSNGNKEHYKCAYCNTLYADAQGKTKTTEEAITTLANGKHNVANGTCTLCHNPVVKYRKPHYVDNDATKGIASWTDEAAVATPVASDEESVRWNTGWYYVPEGANITLEKGAVCNGDVHLILCDGSKLTVIPDKNEYNANICVTGKGNSLCIYGQTAGTGELTATNNTCGAAIGGGDRTIGSNITINGGTVTATCQQEAAAIGGGRFSEGTNITINGGTVTAISETNGAAIGGGGYAPGSNITINGGTLRLTGGKESSAIGGGYWAEPSSNIKVNTNYCILAGTEFITNNGGDLSSTLKDMRDVFIHEQKLTKVGAKAATCSGRGYKEHYKCLTCNTLFSDAKGKTQTTETAIMTFATGKHSIANGACTLCHMPQVAYRKPRYVDGVATKGIASWTNEKAVAVPIESAEELVIWAAGWYYVPEGADVTLKKGAECLGAVHIILCDGSKLTVMADEANNKACICVTGEGNSFCLYGQTAGTGELTATNAGEGAAIGGGLKTEGSNITINGGIVEATNQEFGAAIGGGTSGNGSGITINGGTVTAISEKYGAGIGGGTTGNGSGITINGGTVTAICQRDGAGIGGGASGDGSDITINGGTVTAISKNNGAGIGGGESGNGSDITINIAVVTAKSEGKGSNIGGGRNGTSSNIRINTNNNVMVGTAIIFNTGGDLSFDLGEASNIFIHIHKIGKVETKAATCTEKGRKEHYECSLCHAVFADLNGETELTETSLEIPSLGGHKPVDGICTVCHMIEVTYIDEKGDEQMAYCVPITDADSQLSSGWYVVNGDINLNNGLGIKTDEEVNLILTDGCCLTGKQTDSKQGFIDVSGKLNIFAQRNQTGKIRFGNQDIPTILAHESTINIYGGVLGCADHARISINQGSVTVHNATIYGYVDAGKGTFTMNGGSIINETAASGNNRGCAIANGTATIVLNGGTYTGKEAAFCKGVDAKSPSITLGENKLAVNDGKSTTISFDKEKGTYTTSQYTTYTILSAPLTLGDVYADGKLSVNDLVHLIEIINGNESDVNGTADMEGNGVSNMDDINALLQKVLTESEK